MKNFWPWYYKRYGLGRFKKTFKAPSGQLIQNEIKIVDDPDFFKDIDDIPTVNLPEGIL